MGKSTNQKSTITTGLISGLTASIPVVPDAMASGVLAGVNPIFGLYGLMRRRIRSWKPERRSSTFYTRSAKVMPYV